MTETNMIYYTFPSEKQKVNNAWKTRKELEQFRNIERLAAYQIKLMKMRKALNN